MGTGKLMKHTFRVILPWIERLRRWTSEKRCFNDIVQGLSHWGPRGRRIYLSSNSGIVIYV